MSDTSFEDLLAAAKAGKEWAISDLYREFNPLLLRYLRARAPEVAEDLASEVWIGAARTLGSFSGDRQDLGAWMFTIARRQVIGHWRKASTRKSEPVPVRSLVGRYSTGDDPESIGIGRISAQAAIDTLVRSLPPDQAEVVLLRVVAGLDVERVAEIMGKKPGTVRVLQHRALQKLASELSPSAVTR